MFLLSWLILLTSGARKQSRNRPAFRLPLSRAFKARPEPNGSNVFSISYGVENDEECLRNCLRHCFRTISETVLERGYIGRPKLTQFSRPDISGRQNSRSFLIPIYWESKTHAIFCHEPLTGTAGMPLGTITGGKDRNNRGRCVSTETSIPPGRRRRSR